ncbi:hypothetical protein [Rheinheimera sp.]
MLLKHTARLKIPPFKHHSGKNSRLNLTDSSKERSTHSDSPAARSKAE